jgi:hypothetical protein
MTPKLEHQLIKKYPKLFRDTTKSPKETLMCFGCEHGDGWFDILDKLCGYITHLQESRTYFLATKNGKSIEFHCPDVIFTQIKEKYGTLRVYWRFQIDDFKELSAQSKDPHELDKYLSLYTDTIENAIDFCEYLSSQTCEVTGKPGKLYTQGWCVTLCKEEAVKRFGFDPDDQESEEPKSAEAKS